jgi:hypothetical protein
VHAGSNFPEQQKDKKAQHNSANRGARVVTRRAVARRAAEEEERACKHHLFSHFRR